MRSQWAVTTSERMFQAQRYFHFFLCLPIEVQCPTPNGIMDIRISRWLKLDNVCRFVTNQQATVNVIFHFLYHFLCWSEVILLSGGHTTYCAVHKLNSTTLQGIEVRLKFCMGYPLNLGKLESESNFVCFQVILTSHLFQPIHIVPLHFVTSIGLGKLLRVTRLKFGQLIVMMTMPNHDCRKFSTKFGRKLIERSKASNLTSSRPTSIALCWLCQMVSRVSQRKNI